MPVIAKKDALTEKETRLYRLRHSAAHIMAQAVCELFPDVKLAIGPPIEDGFYYDFDTPHTFTPEDLEKIEERMREIASEDVPFEKIEMPREEARRFLEENNAGPYKLELLDDIAEGEPITFYRSGRFIDLCAGPHIETTGEIKHFKLLKIAGAYWRGVETNPMLQRIYGTAWETEKELKAFLKRLEEAEKRDHRKLGPELQLFAFFEEAGSGLPFYFPKGSVLMNELQKWMYEEHEKRGYIPLRTPHLLKIDLWRISGHLENYRENMFLVKDEENNPNSPIPGVSYGVKPMNCPGHILIYQSQTRSYRDLPLRYFEFGTVYRFERGGTMHGMLRVRGFTQDDAHIFCTPEQYESEVSAVVDFCIHVLDTFGFEYTIGLKTRPDKRLGSNEIWDMAEGGLEKVLKERGIPFYYGHKDATFYGPKVDFIIRDCLGREWQASTIQLDFNLPERFQLEYVDLDGKAKRPVMIHRAILGSFERFIGLLVEEFNGAFPLWCAPVQARILPISDDVNEYARSVLDAFSKEGFRVELDARNETLNKKIREATLAKVPYLIVLGKKEAESGKLSVRSYFDGDLGQMSLPEISARMRKEIDGKVYRRKM